MAPDGVARISDRIRAEQIRILYRIGPVGVVGAAVAALLLVAGLRWVGGSAVVGTELWLASLVLIAGAHLAFCRRFWRAAPAETKWRPWARLFVVFSFAEGTFWGFASTALTTPEQIEQHLLVLLIASSIASGALAVFGVYLPAFYALMFPLTAPYEISALVGRRPFDHALSILLALYILAYAVLALRINRNLTEILRLRFENQDLARDLRIQKEAAEQANIAKSSFLAAASHDLRQPVHALGLLVGALQGHAMSEETRRVVEHIGGSVAAMNGLFNSLLDISRLDAGVVKVAIEDFAIQPLLARVCRDYMEEAESKGLSLILLPCSAVVRTDPVLIERILRNLVSNALRYTDDGRVVVGCRRHDGLRIEVWDTGRGIPADQQQQIFREFYQLANAERDRAKGLGLGLAIVDRLAKLLGCRLSLRSSPGKGSVFGVVVPLSDSQLLDVRPAPQAPVGVFARGLILVIDDDRGIRGATESLLSSWGHEVVAAASLAEMRQRVETPSRRPDLVICDYRLRDGENGIDVIQSLRSDYDDEIPAVLVTGDTAPDRLREAQESGLILLHKPVTNIKLRATVGNLIQSRRVTETL